MTGKESDDAANFSSETDRSHTTFFPPLTIAKVVLHAELPQPPVGASQSQMVHGSHPVKSLAHKLTDVRSQHVRDSLLVQMSPCKSHVRVPFVEAQFSALHHEP